MKLIYIANVRMPTEKAHGIQIMKMCEAFSRRGLEVELVVPWRFNPIKEDPFEYYGIEKNFKITKLPSFDLVNFGKAGFIIQSFLFAKMAFCYVLFKKNVIIYSRDELPLFFLSLFKTNIFWEVHAGVFNLVAKGVIKKCKGIISISGGLKDFYKERGVDVDKILVAPDGVDVEKFEIRNSKSEIRQKLNLPKDKILIGYVGMLKTMGMEKGIDVALKSLKFLDERFLLILVGGREEDIEFYKKMVRDLDLESKVVFAGRVRHQLIPFYLKAFDVLVAPFPETKHYRFYMSPLKIFEYMASGVPVVASDLPSIREILNESSAVLVQPDSAESLAKGISIALQNAELSDRISKKAHKDVQNYTWDKRAENILGFKNSE